MKYSQIRLLGVTLVFPKGKPGDVVTTEFPTARHLVRRKIAEMMIEDLAAEADVQRPEDAFRAPRTQAIGPVQNAAQPEPQARKPGK